MSDSIEYCDDCPANVPCHMERKCLRPKKKPSDMSAADLIKYLNGRRGWHGNQYRSVCGEWLHNAEIKRQALRELAADSLHNADVEARRK